MRVFLAINLVSFGMFVDADPVSAAPSWSVVPSPSPAGPQAGELQAVSCASTTSCLAVGGRVDADGLAQYWDGSSWSFTSSPLPAGAIRVDLRGVSCVSAASCVAVGSSSGTTHDKALAERWDGTSWSFTSSPLPAGAISVDLRGVSCVSAASCVAVGNSAGTTSNRTLAERWDGASWSIMPTPAPPYAGKEFVSLNRVSCPSPTACVAIGSHGFNDLALVEHWDGTTWSIMPTPNPGASQLSDVSCPSPTSCFAVGGAGFHTLAEHWDGTSWSIMPAPYGGYLDGVSCPSVTSCYAVSTSSNSSNPIEHWDGTNWSIIADVGNNFLYSVSCPSLSSCFAAGFDLNRSAPLVEEWNGTSWRRSPPLTGSQSRLEQVVCARVASCFALGSSDVGTNGDTKSLVEHWNGTGWSLMPAPKTGENEGSVTCLSPTSCYAVGHDGAHTLVEHWNGTGWSIVRSPNRAGESANSLSAVSCPAPTSCYAVGSSYREGRGHPYVAVSLVEHWNGSRWSIMPGSFSGELERVSCPSTRSCFAVGNSHGLNLMLHGHGRSWSVMRLPAKAKHSQFSSLSCPTPASCVAVGRVSDTLGGTVLRWNPGRWSVESFPNSSGALESVKCRTSTNCVAVGSTGTKAVAERWDGTTWSLMPIPDTGQTSLHSLACPSPTQCLAVGSRSEHGDEYTLIEQYS